MAVAESIQKVTEAEYLVLERKAEFKSEFFDGEMFAMAGGSLRHSLIATNLAGEFRNLLKGHRCLPFNSDLRVKVEATGLFTYPDLSVVCGEPQFADVQPDTITNPTVIVEVLSDSTEAYDRGKKFEHYRRIATLREYLLVGTREPRIEQFLRQVDGGWLMRDAAGTGAQIELPSLEVTLQLAEVYNRVEFGRVAIREHTPRPH
jgi:Uma2 family endonuclease